jgi:hypothetical protein
MKFKFLTGDVNWMEYGGKFVSSKLRGKGFDYWMVIDFTNMDDACGDDNNGRPKYHAELSSVSPQQAGRDNLMKAFESCGASEGEVGCGDLIKVEVLHSYGIRGLLWQGDGNNANTLLKTAKAEAALAHSGISSAMNKPVNRIGTTAMEAMSGDILGGLARTIASGTTEGKILGKMYEIPEPDHKVQFGTLHPDGSMTNVRMIKQSDMQKCPHCIMVPSHYREDGTCKWGYKTEDFS